MTEENHCSYCGASMVEQNENIAADGGRSFCSPHCEVEFEARRRDEESKEMTMSEEVMVA